jgi:nucleotide-binding universal stress UspA family protein
MIVFQIAQSRFRPVSGRDPISGRRYPRSGCGGPSTLLLFKASVHARDGRYHRWRCGATWPMLCALSRSDRGVMKTIVCAVDESPGAAEAVAVAAGLSKDLGLRLVLAHVVDGYVRTDRVGVSSVQAQDGGQRLLERVTRKHSLESADRRAEVGDRASELSRIAGEEAAVVIVVGSRSQYRRRHNLVSGLSAELRSTAPCPVLVVPPRPRR